MKHLSKTKTVWFRSFYISLLSVVGFAVLVIVCVPMIKDVFSDDVLPRCTLLGDADENGEVMLPDAVLTARAGAGKAALTVGGKLNADINRNGAIDGSDLSDLLMYLANPSFILDPEKRNPETTVTETTTTSTETTVTETTTTSAETTVTETTASSTETTAEATTTEITSETQPTVTGELLTVGTRTFPLGLGSGDLVASLGTPTEEIVCGYQACDMKFFIYDEKPEELYIGIVAHDTVVGYYAVGSVYTAPSDYIVTEYADTYSKGTGKLFAVYAIKKGYTIDMRNIINKEDFSVMAKLNWYATNAVRAMNGLHALNWNQTLNASALTHSKDMADNNFFSHTGSDGSKPKDRIIATGLKTNARGENIDAGYTNPFDALYGWYTSELGHRDNILAEIAEVDPCNFSDIGIAFAYNPDSDYKFYGTQDFANVIG